MNSELFAVKTGEGGPLKGLRWFRTRLDKISRDSSWGMGSQDALKFIAKRSVLILGFGSTGPKADAHPSELLGW